MTSTHYDIAGPFITTVVGPIFKLAVLFAIFGVLIISFRILFGEIAGKSIPNVRRAPLMTNAERRVIAYIEEALPGARIHAQVSMGAIMQPARGLDPRAATITRNRFSSKRVDFLAEDRASGEVIAIIELDDWSHNSTNDSWRDRMTARAGYQTIRLPNGERHTRETVRRRIHAALYPEPSATPDTGTTRRRRP